VLGSGQDQGIGSGAKRTVKMQNSEDLEAMGKWLTNHPAIKMAQRTVTKVSRWSCRSHVTMCRARCTVSRYDKARDLLGAPSPTPGGHAAKQKMQPRFD
jgi:hypothetical protein